MSSPSGSIQSGSTLYEAVPPDSTVMGVVRFCTGAEFTSNGWTVRVTDAVASPPRPSSTV